MSGALTPRESVALDDLAGEIRREVELSEQHWQSAVAHAIRAGELLTEAKSRVQHGEWLPWIEANFPGSDRTARNYMRLAANRQRVADLPTVREAVAALTARTSEPDARPSRSPDWLVAFLFGCETPVPERLRRAMDLMIEVKAKRDYLDCGEWIKPPSGFRDGEMERDRHLEWLAPGSNPDRGPALRAALKVHTEIHELEAEFWELTGWDGPQPEVVARATALLRAMEEGGGI